MSRRRIEAGSPYPLGATWDGRGVNFALFSANALAVELCLFDIHGQRELERVALPEHTDGVWHGYLSEARPGQLYGYRVHGPYDPLAGHRFNAHKLLIDPYARALSGPLVWSDAHFGFRLGTARQDLQMDRRDNARFMPKCRVIDPAFTWGGDRRPGVPWSETVIYEAHARGLTIRHPGVAPNIRGTFLGLGQPAVVEHLRKLGVTTLELLPVHALVDERHLVERRLRNYWGYNSLGFFAPDPRYYANDGVGEFKTTVRRLHDAGIEVILDVVYNHTAEGNHLGPTLCYRGIDNASYYRLVPGDPRWYENYSGCGNTLNLAHPRVLQMVTDSLRLWVEEMHVDGFRFDLAVSLARERDGFDVGSGFLDAVRQDPVLSRVKLIAEPWDLGPDGYRVGGFPSGWSEWNGRYRDIVRRFWRGDGGLIGDLASRLTGSSDLFARAGRRPWASLNFVTAHDGFTLADLVSYEHKRNEANGEDNRDGTDANYGWNCGHEGATKDPEILSLRRRQCFNMMATLLLSQGVPMLVAGDEMGRGQGGNNNAYCQDNEIGWVDWSAVDTAMLAFTRAVAAIRHAYPVFRQPHFLRGKPPREGELKDITWITPAGSEMTEADWQIPFARSLGFMLCGASRDELGGGDALARGDVLLVLLNAYVDTIVYALPALAPAGVWDVVIDTAAADPLATGTVLPAKGQFPVRPHALALLRHRVPAAAGVAAPSASAPVPVPVS